jgi:hypothetical protein
MAHVFISYAHEDKDFVATLMQQIDRAGFKGWIDSEQLRAGEDWRQAIDDGIHKAFALIVIMTPKAKMSEYVTYEWAYAHGAGKKVIPILVKATELHPRLEAFNYLDFTDPTIQPWKQVVQLLGEIKQEAESSKSVKKARESPNTEIEHWIRTLRTSQDKMQRAKAAKALGILESHEAEETLIIALTDTGNRVRQYAIWSLGQIASHRAVPSIAELLNDEYSNVSNAALKALEKIGTLDAKAAIESWQKQDGLK